MATTDETTTTEEVGVMDQRTWSDGAAGKVLHRRWPAGKPRVLIEDPSDLAAVCDHSMFREAGLEVAVCSGPVEVALRRDETGVAEPAPGPCTVLGARASLGGQVRALRQARRGGRTP